MKKNILMNQPGIFGTYPGIGGQLIISHLSTIIFKKRFKAYFQSNEPPIEN